MSKQLTQREVNWIEGWIDALDADTYAAAILRKMVTAAHSAHDAEQRAEQAEAERDRLKLEAESWAQEARTQRTTVQEIYQLCSGATGEPGDWNGAEPVRRVIRERDTARQEAAKLRGALQCLLQAAHQSPRSLISSYRLVIECALQDSSSKCPEGFEPTPHREGCCQHCGEDWDHPNHYADILHSSDAPASEAGLDEYPSDVASMTRREYLQSCGHDTAPADCPECSCNPGWPENCPVHGDGELEDVVETETDAEEQMHPNQAYPFFPPADRPEPDTNLSASINSGGSDRSEPSEALDGARDRIAKEIAIASGCSRQHVENWETGEHWLVLADAALQTIAAAPTPDEDGVSDETSPR